MVTAACVALVYLRETNTNNQISAISASDVPAAAAGLTLSSDAFSLSSPGDKRHLYTNAASASLIAA